MALTPAGRRSSRRVYWLVAVVLAAGAAFVVLRLVTPGDGTQVPPRTWAWTGDGVLVQAASDTPWVTATWSRPSTAWPSAPVAAGRRPPTGPATG